MSFMVNPYVFAAPAGPTTDVLIAVQDFTFPGATGAQSYTTTTLTGITPAAALLVSTSHDPTNDPGESAGLNMSMGAVTATAADERAMSFASGDNLASTDCARAFIIDKCLNQSGYQADGSMISGGISLNYSAAGALSRRGVFVAFAGADVSAKSGSISLGTGTSAISVTTSFQPDAVIFFGTHRSSGSASGIPVAYSFGVAINGSQRGVLGAEAQGAGSGAPRQAILTNRIGGEISATGALSYDLTAGGFSGTGFTVTPSASSGSDTHGYLALKFTGRQVALVDFTTPTTTGSHAVTGAGFTPQFALVVLTNLEATDPAFPVATSDLCGGFSVSFIADEQWSTGIRADSGADPTDTASQSRNVALIGPSATDCDALAATLTGFNSDGMTLNYSAVQGTAKKGFVLFVE